MYPNDDNWNPSYIITEIYLTGIISLKSHNKEFNLKLYLTYQSKINIIKGLEHHNASIISAEDEDEKKPH